MSCQHGNHVDDCDLCNELLSEYRAGVEIGKKDGWEACEACHGIVDGKHMEAESLRQQLTSQRRGTEMNSYELEQALACKQMEVEDLRQQVAAQAEAIDLQLHTNRRIAELEQRGQPMSKISDMQDLLKPACDEDGHPITQRQWDELRQQFNAANKLINAYREESISKGEVK